MHRNSAQGAGQIIGQMGGLQVIGLDIAKSVFQLHSVDMATGEIVNLQLKRAKVLEHFANRAPCVIGIEACGGAHHWARELTAQGHTVRLIHAKAVRPFVSGNKTDATDARAIWLAVQQPGTKFVGMKTLAQQATLTLHRQRPKRHSISVPNGPTHPPTRAAGTPRKPGAARPPTRTILPSNRHFTSCWPARARESHQSGRPRMPDNAAVT